MFANDVSSSNPLTLKLQGKVLTPTAPETAPTSGPASTIVALSDAAIQKILNTEGVSPSMTNENGVSLQELIDRLAEIYQRISELIEQAADIMNSDLPDDEKVTLTATLYQEVGVLQSEASQVMALIMKLLSESAK